MKDPSLYMTLEYQIQQMAGAPGYAVAIAVYTTLRHSPYWSSSLKTQWAT